MKKILLFSILVAAGTSIAQTQIGNGDMEQWGAVSGGSEPTNWNSFLTAQGFWSTAAQNQIEESPSVRPGSSGTKSAKIWSRSAFGIIANGNVTLGRINMGSTTPSSPDNYNISLTADADFSEALTDSPDSIVFWANFVPAGGGGDQARMKSTLHTAFDYKDPEDAASSAEVVATAVENFGATNGWQRFAIPYDYSGPASNHQYILVTFTTNMNPGGGSDNDQLWIDDVELIYNNTGGPVDTDGDGVIDTTEGTDGTDPNDLCSFVLASQTVAPSATWNSSDCDFDGVSNADELTNGTDPLVEIAEVALTGVSVFYDNAGAIIIDSENTLDGTYAVYNSLGQVVQSGNVSNTIDFEAKTGIYFVHLITQEGTGKFQILKK